LFAQRANRGTRWIRVNIREPFADHENLGLMLVIGRLVNWPLALEELIAERAWPLDESFDPSSIARVLKARADHGEKIITSAYIVAGTSGKGKHKADYIACIAGGCVAAEEVLQSPPRRARPDDGAHARRAQNDRWLNQSSMTAR
jgi:hypothetical protein